MKLLVSGYMIRHPLAGNVFAFFHYILGLQRLGHEVVYVEESGWQGSCYDPVTGLYSDDPSRGIEILAGLAERFGSSLILCYVDRESGRATGMSLDQLRSHAASADLLLNIGGTCALQEFGLCRQRVLIDMDPMFTQVGRFAGENLHEHAVHFSYGTNIGRAGCTVPEAGIAWHPLVPPVVPDIWHDPAPVIPRNPRMTTICNWGAYGSIEYDGERYGQKNEEFERLLQLPSRSPLELEIAIAGADDATKRTLLSAGWKLSDATQATASFDAYASYMGGSFGEFSVAKNAYVKSRSGWFSDRSVCYLASGRPLVLQDTGASNLVPESAAVQFFSSEEQAAEQLESVRADYPRRSLAAQELANDFFSYRTVLPDLLERSFGDGDAARISAVGQPGATL